MSEKTVVKYTGSSTRRFVTKDEWTGAGVKGQKTVEWNKENDYGVDIADLSDEALEVLRKDKAFEIPERPAAPDAVEVDTEDAPPIVVEAPKAEAPKAAPKTR